ncbi:unnamed protein product [Spodoptera littoralis]|uniref:RING-type domain-containing protein n=1 Tax=Spodoptera littoralis TaxID=7109 RepID=A0A9P0IGT6_SPOLI|nr:unnamed protein product [Spodoptera littoralis]CAH1646666.1 unnamed protein product [Spodoptera littoralis]
MNNINIDKSIQHVENIVQNNQCSVCAKTDGQRLRYSCGHTACDDCVIDVIDCSICLTPPQVSSPQPRLDNVLTQRVKNASTLLRECQKLFNTDAITRKRLSEQLRIEKELFPKCIQAPLKYENKRKSSFNLSKNKENWVYSFLPGEAILHLDKDNTMENSFKYVQQWLNKNDNDFVRKPFRDLNVNTHLNHNVKHSSNQYETQNNFNKILLVSKTNRKRTHYKTTVSNQSFRSPKRKSVMYQDTSSKKIKIEQPTPTTSLRHEPKHDNDESGIFMDNDPIVIDDSQETAIDKDRNAWLAVLEANEHEQNESTSVVHLDCSDPQYIPKEIANRSEGKQSRRNQNVPFYKKSYITETCTLCNVDKKTTAQPEDVKITIDNPDFTTTIKILNCAENGCKLKTKNSVSVQTDIFEVFNGNDSAVANLNDTNDNIEDVAQKSDTQSEDLFGDEEKHNENDRPSHDYKCLVIAESDSDMELERSGPLPVKVDVHRSCDETDYGILSEIENIQEHTSRSRRGPRGLTPTSTDSSEKENFNPNRLKTQTNKKKKYSKKL